MRWLLITPTDDPFDGPNIIDDPNIITVRLGTDSDPVRKRRTDVIDILKKADLALPAEQVEKRNGVDVPLNQKQYEVLCQKFGISKRR